MVGVVTNNFTIQLKEENENNNNDNNNNNNGNNNNNNSDGNKDQPSIQGGVDVFDPKDPMELEKQAEMLLKGPIDPMVKTTNLFSIVTVGTA